MTATEQGALGIDEQPCRECGAPIPYFGKGRRRRVCDACRPGWWPEVVREPTNIRRSVSGRSERLLQVPMTAGRVRAADPATSAHAAKTADVRSLPARIVDAYCTHGELTPFEVVHVLGLEHRDGTVRSAVGHMKTDGVLEGTGETRPSPSNRPSEVLRLAKEGS